MTEHQSTELQRVYREARRLAGKHAVQMVLVANRAISGHLPDVPEANRAKCQRDLQRLIDGERGTDAERVDPLDPIRVRAYGEKAKPARTLDSASIFKKFNRKSGD